MKVAVVRSFPSEPEHWHAIVSRLDNLGVDRFAIFECPNPKITWQDKLQYALRKSSGVVFLECSGSCKRKRLELSGDDLRNEGAFVDVKRQQGTACPRCSEGVLSLKVSKKRPNDKISTFRSQLEYLIDSASLPAFQALPNFDGLKPYLPQYSERFFENTLHGLQVLPMETTHAAFLPRERLKQAIHMVPPDYMLKAREQGFLPDELMDSSRSIPWLPRIFEQLGGVVLFSDIYESSSVRDIQVINEGYVQSPHFKSVFFFPKLIHSVNKIRLGTQNDYSQDFKGRGHALEKGKSCLISVAREDMAILDGYQDPPEVGFFRIHM